MKTTVLKDEVIAHDGDTLGEYRVSIEGVHADGESVSEASQGQAVVVVALKSDGDADAFFLGGGDAEAYNTIGKAMGHIMYKVSTSDAPKINRLAFLMGLAEWSEKD